jgi:hypothetical protein
MGSLLYKKGERINMIEKIKTYPTQVKRVNFAG